MSRLRKLRTDLRVVSSDRSFPTQAFSDPLHSVEFISQNNITIQSKAQHPRTGYTGIRFCSRDLDLDLDLMTLIYELDPKILMMYVLIQKGFQKSADTQTFRQTRPNT